MPVQSWNYRPRPRFFGSDSDLHFGFEIEMENEQRKITSDKMAGKLELANSLEGAFYAKADNSISNGLEWVSHPLTYDYMRERSAWFKRIMATCRRSGFRSGKKRSSTQNATCGMHIHVSREAFTAEQIGKVVRFVYGFPRFIEKISRRDVAQLNRWASPRSYRQASLESLRVRNYMTSRNERYTAVNLSNRNTIEFRIFRGTLNPESFWQSVQFVKALHEFTASTVIEDCRPGKFREYVRTQAERFPELVSFINKRWEN